MTERLSRDQRARPDLESGTHSRVSSWPFLLLVTCACAATNSAPAREPVGASIAPLLSVERALIQAAVDSITQDVVATTTVCIQLLGGPEGAVDLPADLLTELATGHRAVTDNRCPTTYARMIARVDSVGRSVDPLPPPGYVDPVHLSVGRPQFDRTGTAFVYARRSQGMSGQDYLCTVQSYQERARAACRILSRWIH